MERTNQPVMGSRQRQSNLELLRILAMLSIVAHHSVVNSGITQYFSFQQITTNMVFLQLWGMWGKTAINSFVLITGYFMCESHLTWKRYAKMFLEYKFYRVMLVIIFAVTRYAQITKDILFDLIFGISWTTNSGFSTSFLTMYLFIPFMNVQIRGGISGSWSGPCWAFLQ